MFAGQLAVVSGAGSGIGRSLAWKLAQKGAEVWALDVDQAALDQLAANAAKYALTIKPCKADVTRPQELEAVRDEIEASGKLIHFWVNNAGIAGTGDFLEFDAQAFERVIAVDLIGLVNGTRIALASMEQAGLGKIVNMGSIAGHLPCPYLSAYNAAKYGVTGFTRALQAELRMRDSPVRLLLVSPGFVDTAIINKGEALGFPAWLSFLLGKPEAVADEIIVAMSTNADEVTPTLNGRLMKTAYKLAPRTTVRSARLLLTQSLKDAVMGRYAR